MHVREHASETTCMSENTLQRQHACQSTRFRDNTHVREHKDPHVAVGVGHDGGPEPGDVQLPLVDLLDPQLLDLLGCQRGRALRRPLW